MEHPKKCVEMEKTGQPAQISDFDYEHFCNGDQSTATTIERLRGRKLEGKNQSNVSRI